MGVLLLIATQVLCRECPGLFRSAAACLSLCTQQVLRNLLCTHVAADNQLCEESPLPGRARGGNGDGAWRHGHVAETVRARTEDIVAFFRLPRGEALAQTLVETPEASGTRLDVETPDKDGHRVPDAREAVPCATLAPACCVVASQGDVPAAQGGYSAEEGLDARADWAFYFLDGMDAELKAALPGLAAQDFPAGLQGDVTEDNEAVMSALAARLGVGAAACAAEPEEEDDAELAALRDQAERGVDVRSNVGQRFLAERGRRSSGRRGLRSSTCGRRPSSRRAGRASAHRRPRECTSR